MVKSSYIIYSSNLIVISFILIKSNDDITNKREE